MVCIQIVTRVYLLRYSLYIIGRTILITLQMAIYLYEYYDNVKNIDINKDLVSEE